MKREHAEEIARELWHEHAEPPCRWCGRPMVDHYGARQTYYPCYEQKRGKSRNGFGDYHGEHYGDFSE